MNPYSLVKLLPVSARLYGVHHDILGSHKRKLGHEVSFYNLRVNHEALGNVHVKLQDSVGGEERLAYGDSLVGRIVKGSLEPLGGRRDCRIHGVGHHVICKRSHSLGTHRISLICHGGRAYLMLLKRFLHFLHVLKKSYIVGKFMGGLGDARQNVQHTAVHFSGICLSGNGIASVEAHLFRNLSVESLALLMVSLEQLHERCLGSRGSLGAEKLHGGKNVIQVVKVHNELVEPQGRPLAHGGRLCCLIVGVRKARH